MIWLIAGFGLSLTGYAVYVARPAAFLPFTHLAPLWVLLCLGYAALLRGAYGTWSFPFLGFGSERSQPSSVDKDSGARRRVVLIWGGAILFRALLVPLRPVLSDDMYRYIWDGRVLLAGINPYRYPPIAPELQFLRNALWPLINHSNLPTIYPPLCMLFFAAAAWIAPTVLSWKLVATSMDLLAGYMFMEALAARGKPRAWVAMYLCHPLVLFEFAGNGHVDAVGVLFLSLAFWAWAKGQPLKTGIALGLGGMVKFLPWIALPSLWPRLRARWWLVPLLIAACYLGFWGRGLSPLGSLGVFVAKWRGNDFLFSLVVPADATEAQLHAAKLVALASVVLVWLVTMVRRRDWISTYAWTAGVLLLVSPVLHPWYVIWLLPVLFVLPHPAWWVWSLTVIMAYQPLAQYRATGIWEESLAWKAWEVSPALTLLPIQAWLEWKAARER
jgi:hypothetical protein